MKRSKKYEFAIRDFINGAILVVFPILLPAVGIWAYDGEVNWNSVLKTSLFVFITYVGKNYLSNSKGEILKPE